jgi:hypothetical protein
LDGVVAAGAREVFEMNDEPQAYQPIKLTPNEALTLAFIRERAANKRWPPTIREISVRVGVTYNNAKRCVFALQKKGYISLSREKKRSIELVLGAFLSTSNTEVRKPTAPREQYHTYSIESGREFRFVLPRDGITTKDAQRIAYHLLTFATDFDGGAFEVKA